jgi:uncharacterized protein (DUF58 family)
LQVYALVGVLGLAGSLATGQPEPAIFGVSLLVLVIVGLVSTDKAEVTVKIEDAPTSIVEGEERVVDLSIVSDVRLRGLGLDLGLGPGLDLVGVEGGRLVDRSHLTLDVDGRADVRLRICSDGWGRRSMGPIASYAAGGLGMLETSRVGDQTVRMISVPSDVIVKELLLPRDTNLHAGDLVSKLRGVGSEFSELRRYQDGDDPRSLNWRVSSRAGSWWVNDRHPERNGDVVLVVDGQTQSGTGADVLVDRAVRLTGALLRAYGRRRYRLGLVTVDGVARWIQPGSGETHRRRLLDQLLGIQEGDSSRASIERAVLRVAKTPALVIILTPMLDDSLAGIAHSLRVSGVDLALVEIDPIGLLPAPTSESRAMGRRLWKLERERIRDLLAGDGIPVAPWSSGESADVPLALISTWRSSSRLPV